MHHDTQETIQKEFNWNCGKYISTTFIEREERKENQSEILLIFYFSYDDNNPESIKKRKHIRSNSCDVKIGRSNSREYDPEYRNRRGFGFQRRGHSRNNSHDLGL